MKILFQWQDWNNPKIEDNFKTYDNPKKEDDLKNDDNPKIEEAPKWWWKLIKKWTHLQK